MYMLQLSGLNKNKNAVSPLTKSLISCIFNSLNMKIIKGLHFIVLLCFFLGQLGPAWGLAPQTEVTEEVHPRNQARKELEAFFARNSDEEKLGPLLPRAPYVVFDFETTDLDPEKAKPIEIAALKFRGTELVAKLHLLVDPEEPLKEIVTKITGITGDMLVGKTNVKDAITQFLRFSKGSILVGHNMDGLDRPMLKNLIAKYQLPYNPFKGQGKFDTRSMAQRLIPRTQGFRYTLEDLAQLAELDVIPKHTALSDAIVTALVYWHLKPLDNEVFHSMEKQLEHESEVILDKLQILYDFLQGSTFVSDAMRFQYWLPRSDMVVFFGNSKLDGFNRVARSYQWEGTKKVLVIWNGKNLKPSKFAVQIDAHKQHSKQPGIGEDLIVKSVDGLDHQKLKMIATVLEEHDIDSGEIVLMGDPLLQRKRLLMIEKLKRKGDFPPEVTVRNVPIQWLDIAKVKKELIKLKEVKRVLEEEGAGKGGVKEKLKEKNKKRPSKEQEIVNWILDAISRVEILRSYVEKLKERIKIKEELEDEDVVKAKLKKERNYNKDRQRLVRKILNNIKDAVTQIETLRYYGEKGFIEPIEIPDEVDEAYRQLRQAMSPKEAPFELEPTPSPIAYSI